VLTPLLGVEHVKVFKMKNHWLQNISENTIRKHPESVDWEYISYHLPLSEDFILDEFKQKKGIS
jgi:hypothetical protein